MWDSNPSISRWPYHFFRSRWRSIRELRHDTHNSNAKIMSAYSSFVPHPLRRLHITTCVYEFDWVATPVSARSDQKVTVIRHSGVGAASGLNDAADVLHTRPWKSAFFLRRVTLDACFSRGGRGLCSDLAVWNRSKTAPRSTLHQNIWVDSDSRIQTDQMLDTVLYLACLCCLIDCLLARNFQEFSNIFSFRIQFTTDRPTAKQPDFIQCIVFGKVS